MAVAHQPRAPVRPVAQHGTPVPSRDLPAWPVLALLWGFPLWWLLGMTPFIVVIMATVMAALLLIRRGLRLVPGIAPWLTFVAWALPCGLMLDSALRVVGYGQRVGNYLAIAVVLVYVVNARERLTNRRLLAALTAVWVTVVVGGYLGVLFPYGRLTTPVGLLLPEAITSNEYVRDLVFPPFAEIQHPWGADEPYIRPAAPFPYTNGWGAAMALLTPVAITQLLTANSVKTKLALAGCLAAAVVPAVATLNRGMFLGLALALCYVVLRLAARGVLLPVLAVTGVGIGGALVASSYGLLDRLTERAEYGSTSDRLRLYQETLVRTLDSPLFGYGAPRPSDQVAVSVGTQGHLWMVLFSFGFVGLALFLWFLWGGTLRTWSLARGPLVWLHATLVVACAMIVFYGLDTMQLLTVALVTAFLLRERARTAPG